MVPFYRVEFHKRLGRKINPDDLKFKVLEAKYPESHFKHISSLIQWFQQRMAPTS